MSKPDDPGISLLQLAVSLRMAAQRLAESAGRMQQAASHQRDQLERLARLRDRLVELLAACRQVTEKQGSKPPPPLAKPTQEPLYPRAAAAAPSGGPRPAKPAGRRGSRLPASAFVEFSNWREFDKFRRMEPITQEEVAGCNIDELIQRLSAE